MVYKDHDICNAIRMRYTVEYTESEGIALSQLDVECVLLENRGVARFDRAATQWRIVS